MQERQDRHDYPTVNDPSFSSTLSSDGGARTTVSALEPYIPPNVPHVVRFATLSSMDLPLEVRNLIILTARFADVHGVASVAHSTLCEICRIRSHHTVERWISLAADGSWAPPPVGRPDTNPIAQPFSRRLFQPLLPRRDGRGNQQLQKPEAPLRKPRVHGMGGQ